MEMSKYRFTLSGITSLLMHADNVNGQELVKEFLRIQNGKKQMLESASDRFPAWTWTTYVYHDGTQIVFPVPALLRCLSEAGKQIPRKKSNLKETVMTSLSIEGLDPDGEFLELKCGPTGAAKLNTVSLQPIMDLTANEKATFLDHANLAKKLGFELDVRRACLNKSTKPIRVRPRFRQWEITGVVAVTDDKAISHDELVSLFEIAGSREGLGDWRPSSPKSPGRFGMFKANLVKIAG